MSEQTVNVNPWKSLSTLPLPSGAVIKVRKRNLQTLLMADIMPMELVNKVQKMSMSDAKDNPGAAVTLTEYLRIIVENCIVEPVIIMKGEPKEGEVSVADIPPEDLTAIIAYFNGRSAAPKKEERDLSSFRAERDGAHAGGPVQAVQAEAVGSGGPAAA